MAQWVGSRIRILRQNEFISQKNFQSHKPQTKWVQPSSPVTVTACWKSPQSGATGREHSPAVGTQTWRGQHSPSS